MSTMCIYEELQEQIAAVPTDEDRINQAKTCLALIKTALTRMDIPADEQELSRIKALQIFYQELIWMEHQLPLGDHSEQLSYFRREMEFIRRYFSRHGAHYQLYKVKTLDMEDVDDLPYMVLVPGEQKDQELFTRFRAYEQLQAYILRRICELEDMLSAGRPTRSGRMLQWTGDQINLVEVIYGLYETAQLNHGQASLADITKAMEYVFQVNLHGGYQHFENIKQRKRISPTRFLEQMRSAVQHRIEQDDAFIPSTLRKA